MVTIIDGIEQFNKIIESTEKVLIDFYADWCGPCKMMGPIIEEICEDNLQDDLKICKVNVDKNSELAQKFSILSIPTLIYFKNGEISAKVTGVRPKEEILKLLV
jgi:thioredoxin 1